MVVQNAGEAVRESLLMGITAPQTLNSSQRSRGPLKQWLQVEAKPNQRELVGLIKAVTVARPATSVAAASLVVALGSYIEKWTVQEEFLVEFLFSERSWTRR